MRKRTLAVFGAALLLAGMACVAHAAGLGKAPAFTLKDADGKVFALDRYKGKNVVLMSFWASWCAPCIQEMPMLEKIYQKYRKQGLEILSINIDTSSGFAKAQQIVRRKAVTFPVLYDSDSKVVAIYYPENTPPYTVLINKDGDIVFTHKGFNAGDERELEAEVKKALGL